MHWYYPAAHRVVIRGTPLFSGAVSAGLRKYNSGQFQTSTSRGGSDAVVFPERNLVLVLAYSDRGVYASDVYPKDKQDY